MTHYTVFMLIFGYFYWGWIDYDSKITVSSSIEKERNKMLSRIHVLLFDKNLVDVGKADVQFRG